MDIDKKLWYRIIEESEKSNISIKEILKWNIREFYQRNGIFISSYKNMKVSRDLIVRKEFDKIASKECRAIWQEYIQINNPTFERYKISVREFLKYDAFPTWRVDRSNTKYEGVYEKEINESFLISYQSLGNKPQIYQSSTFSPGFNINNDYFSKTNKIIVFCCKGCGVYVVKDGNHRLLQSAIYNLDKELEVYQVSSNNWAKSTIDMKNFCKCSYFVNKNNLWLFRI